MNILHFNHIGKDGSLKTMQSGEHRLILVTSRFEVRNKNLHSNVVYKETGNFMMRRSFKQRRKYIPNRSTIVDIYAAECIMTA